MKAKNIGGKIYVRPMPIKDILKHFIEAFKLQFVCLILGGVLTWGRRVPEAADKIAFYRVKVFLFELF